MSDLAPQQPPVGPLRRPSRSILAVGLAALIGGLAVAAGLKWLAESEWLREKQPLGWVVYLLWSLALGLSLACSLALSSRLLGWLMPRLLAGRAGVTRIGRVVRWTARRLTAALVAAVVIVVPLAAVLGTGLTVLGWLKRMGQPPA